MNKIWMMLALGVLIGLGGYTWWRSASDAPSYQAPTTQPPGNGVVGKAKLDKDPFDISITYTAAGFDPSEITVPQGTRVRFINTSNQESWPASGVHPTHTLYPEKESTDCLGSSFDSCAALKGGEFFDFTFYYPGAWPYHDHVHAYNSGTVTVVASSSSTH